MATRWWPVMTHAWSRSRAHWLTNRTAPRTRSSTRCCTASGLRSRSGSPIAGTRCASTSRTARSGTATSCAGWLSVLPTPWSSCVDLRPRAEIGGVMQSSLGDGGESVTDDRGALRPRIVAILGTGVMGSTLLSGLIRSGRDASELIITGRNAERTGELARLYGVRQMTNVDAAHGGDTLVLVVKPQDMEGLLAEICGHVAQGTLVVSLAAGITTAFLEERLPAGTAVVRVMPNTPALVDEGMAAVSAGQHCDEVHLREAEDLLRSCGKVLRVAEKHLDAVTAISGSGPAYIFYVVEAMIEAGVLLGMPRTTSTELVVQTLYGAATMLKETGEHPTVLREQVSSPGGTTMAALRELDDHKVRAAFVTAIEAAALRSKQLASGSG